jgi:hypothetical protein
MESRHRCYHFRLTPGLNKILADRRATIQISQVRDRVRAEIQRARKDGPRIERVLFPEEGI